MNTMRWTAIGVASLAVLAGGCSATGAAMEGFRIGKNSQEKSSNLKVYLDGNEATQNKFKKAYFGHASFKVYEPVSTSPTLTTNTLMRGYHTANLFNATIGKQLGPVNASLTINNLLDTEPTTGGYDRRDPHNGLGSFSPFSDLLGRRYSINLSMDF